MVKIKAKIAYLLLAGLGLVLSACGYFTTDNTKPEESENNEKKEEETHTHSYSSEWENDGTTHFKLCSCGDKTEVASHTFTYVQNSDGHYQKCEICGYATSKVNHYFDNGVVSKEATCTEEGLKIYTCVDCGYQKSEVLGSNGHKYSSTFSIDENGHWFNCTVCNQKASYSAHTYVYKKDENKHYQVCSACGFQKADEPHTFDVGTIVIKPTCTEKGLKVFTCTACGYQKSEEVDAKNHSFSDEWTLDENGHWHICAGCDVIDGYASHLLEYKESANGHYQECSVCGYKSDEEGHVYNEGEVTTPQTCVEKGVRTYTCTLCGSVKTEEISPDGHTYEETFSNDEKGHWYRCVTCDDKKDYTEHSLELVKTESGHYHQCSICGYKEDAEKHNFDEGTVIDEPTCTKKGLKILTCKDCGYQENVELDFKEHSYYLDFNDEGHWNICSVCWHIDNKSEHSFEYVITNVGHYAKCSVCDYETDVESHIFDEGEVTTSQTCTESGVRTYTCTLCGATKTESIDPNGHTYCSTWLNDEEGHWLTCVSCGEKGDYSQHDYNITVIEKETCTSSGSYLYTCKVCSLEKEVQAAALGHDLSYFEKNDATCTTNGHEGYYKCSRCNKFFLDADGLNEIEGPQVIKASGHKFKFTETIKEPTCLEKGESLYTCATCGETEIVAVDVLDHDLVMHEGKEPTETESGYKEYVTCTRCSYTTYEEIPALGDEHNYEKVTIEPTYSEKGYDLYACSHCGDTYTNNYVDYLKPNIVSDSSENGSIIYSYRDENSYYYLVYEGHISDYVYHSKYNFLFNDELKNNNEFPNIANEITGEELLLTYNSNREIFDKNLKSKIGDATLVNDDNSLAKTNELLSTSGLSTPIEISDPNMEGLANSISNLTSNYDSNNLDISKFEFNTYYSYAVVGDIDLYYGVFYDIKTSTYSYCPVTLQSGDLSEKLIASSSSNLYADLSSINITNLDLSKPSVFETKYTIETRTYRAYTDQSVGLSIKSMLLGCITSSISDYNDLINSGYDRVKLTCSFSLNCGGGLWPQASNSCKVCFADEDEIIIGDWQGDFAIKKDEYLTYTITASADSSRLKNGNIAVYFYNTGILTMDVTNFELKCEFYNQNAYENNAYPELNS